MHPRLQRTKKEQSRRDAQANRLRAIRKRIREGRPRKDRPELIFGFFPWPCRKCGVLTPADKIKFRVCPVCIAGKEEKAEKVLLSLLKAGIEERTAKDQVVQLVIGC